MFTRKRKGQSILEYAILMGIIVAVFVSIQIYVKRAVQGKFKSSADQIGEQFTTGEVYTIQTVRQTAREEQTLAELSAGEGTAWSESKIQNQDDAAWANSQLQGYTQKAGDYRGAEISATDYVTGVSGTDATANIGTHAGFDSGKISDKALYEDD